MHRSLRLLFVGLALLVPATSQTAIALNGAVYDGFGGPLLAGHVYHVIGTGAACGIHVPPGQMLTIQAGAIVKVNGCWTVNGTLQALGTAAQPIVVTSIHDDTAGGDTNQNGAATRPQPGDWSGADCPGGSVVFEHTTFRYGGRAGAGFFNLRNGTNTFRHCVFELGGGGGLYNAGNCLCDDTEFRDLVGLPITGWSLVASSGSFDNRALRCAAGDYARVDYSGTLTTDVTLQRRNSMNDSGVLVWNLPAPNNLVVAPGRTLTLGPGLTIKFVAGNLTSSGRILAQGNPAHGVVFTSIHDDVFGGDTNRNGAATQGTPGDWGGIVLSPGDASQFDYSVLRYGGTASSQALRVDGSVVMQTCLVMNSAGTGIRFGSPGTPRASLRDTAVMGCVGHGIRDIHWTTLGNCRGVACVGNGSNHIGVIGETITQPVVIERHCFTGVEPVLESYGNLAITTGGLLELPAGTLVKRSSFHQMTVSNGGTLRLLGTARRPVVLTSFRDDTVGGDTNRDGAATQPAPGDWGNVLVQGTGSVQMENVLLRYAGNQALNLGGSGQNELRRVRVERANGIGFWLGNVAVADDLVAWNCLGDGIHCASGAFAVRHATAVGNSGFGIRRPSTQFTGQVRNSIAFANAGGNFGVPASQVFHSCGGFAGSNGCLDVDPLLTNAALGDLLPGPSSPCLGAADLAIALAVGRDAAEFPRVLDPLAGGFAAPDMGAHERAAWQLVAIGEPLLNGSPLQFSVVGPAGLALFAIGLDDGPAVPLPPYGALLCGTTMAIFASAPVGGQVPYSIVGGAWLLGVNLAVQALGTNGSGASFTNVDRLRIRR